MAIREEDLPPQFRRPPAEPVLIAELPQPEEPPPAAPPRAGDEESPEPPFLRN